MSSTELRRAWTAFRSPGRLIALAVAALTVITLGLLFAGGTSSGVSDTFWFRHQDLGRDGTITVRMTSMTGTITYPPPGHDQIVSGLVPWAKAGIIVKDGLRQGTRYAALAMTGGHGVRFQHDYVHDVAGSAIQTPRWLRLTRSGDTITGSESADGEQWHVVGTAELTGLPETVQVGLFATSPGDLTLRETGLGGTIEQVRFTQAVGVFDNVSVQGGTGSWDSQSVGEMNHTDWEKFHNASGVVEKDGVVTISGTGDIGPIGEGGAGGAERALSGLVIALIIVLVVAARYGARDASSRQVIAARTVVIGSATFVTGLLGAGIVLATAPLPTGARVAVGVAAVLALCAVLSYGLGVWLRRGWAAILVALTLVAVPYAVTAVPLLPDDVAEWLLRLTPAAGFAVKQTLVEFPQVTAHYAPSAGYFPLPGWAGFAVLVAYTAAVLWPVLRSSSPGSTRTPLPVPPRGSSG
ncbi:hypothetical protein SAMN04488564_113255 [Lentzea waywayandensis]|uniref:DUF1349 domain-containing protein n=1 Tax=Lentzea waywayandensis TaxID=84724 RepID=A0A1I6FF57_9PSEU|nr:hypothetical protein [Lentzea waywayandensis]SFR28407.1 hypothetical protein SAMN04488564_113255 [Lentzea waywayandensis]